MGRCVSFVSSKVQHPLRAKSGPWRRSTWWCGMQSFDPWYLLNFLWALLLLPIQIIRTKMQQQDIAMREMTVQQARLIDRRDAQEMIDRSIRPIEKKMDEHHKEIRMLITRLSVIVHTSQCPHASRSNARSGELFCDPHDTPSTSVGLDDG